MTEKFRHPGYVPADDLSLEAPIVMYRDRELSTLTEADVRRIVQEELQRVPNSVILHLSAYEYGQVLRHLEFALQVVGSGLDPEVTKFLWKKIADQGNRAR